MTDPVRSAMAHLNHDIAMVRTQCLKRKMSIRQGSEHLTRTFWLYYRSLDTTEQKNKLMDWFRKRGKVVEKELREKLEGL